MGNETSSQKGSKIFYTIISLLIIGSIAVTFYKIVVMKDYQVIATTSCNPELEKCFKAECDPTDDDSCPQNIEERATYYKKISKKASVILLCEKTTEKNGCNEELSCTAGELSCSYTYCSPDSLEEGEQCAE